MAWILARGAGDAAAAEGATDSNRQARNAIDIIKYLPPAHGPLPRPPPHTHTTVRRAVGIRYGRGDVIYSKGDEAGEVFVVWRGDVELRRRLEFPDVQVARHRI